MKIISVDRMIDLEKAAIAAGTSAEELMEKAGQKMAAMILDEFPSVCAASIFVGKGNNGGDGLVIARELLKAGWDLRIHCASSREELSELPSKKLRELLQQKPDLKVTFPGGERVSGPPDELIIDALLGIGLRGPARGETATCIRLINERRRYSARRVIAVDCPSGLGEGAIDDSSVIVVADETFTVGFPKQFLIPEKRSAWVGGIRVIPLFPEIADSADELSVASEMARLLPRRSHFSYKGNYGRVLVLGGSSGFSGAPVLSSLAALRVGAGLVNIGTAPTVCSIVASRAPIESMVSAYPDSAEFRAAFEKADVFAIGPGLGLSEPARSLLAQILHDRRPKVIDADALTLLSRTPELLRWAVGEVILTPHPGEMARLAGRKCEPDQREEIARDFVESHKVVLVLKGSRTIIARAGDPLLFNSTGNAGLASGGSGDILTGVIAGLWAQGLSAWDAARFGVFLHGMAADLALRSHGCEEGMTATDTAEKIPAAIQQIRLSN